MMKQILSAMVLTVPICAAVPQMASAQSLNGSDFISSDETKQAKEYKLNVEGLGTVTVLSAYATDAPGRTCLVRKDSLVQMIKALPPGPTAGPTFVNMKAHTMPDGSLGCWGPGGGCKIIIGPLPTPDSASGSQPGMQKQGQAKVRDAVRKRTGKAAPKQEAPRPATRGRPGARRSMH